MIRPTQAPPAWIGKINERQVAACKTELCNSAEILPSPPTHGWETLHSPPKRGDWSPLARRTAAAGETRPPISGYWYRPDETANAFHGAWLLTGDTARRDADGYLHILGRKQI